MIRDTPRDDYPGTMGSSGQGVSSTGPMTGDEDAEPDWLKVSRQSFEASTRWIDAGIRKAWDETLRAHAAEHPHGSKYLSEDYKFRSKLYVPKLRSAQRKSEAQAAAAFFATATVADIQPEDDSDDTQLASAAVMRELVQYRLTKTIPWFLTVIGAWQDGSLTGVVISKQWWKYSRRQVGSQERPVDNPILPGLPIIDEASGEPIMETVPIWQVEKDEPSVDLLPAENFRLSPTCDWRDPVNTSPYVIEIIPMIVADVRERMSVVDDKTGQPEWKKLTDGQIAKARVNQPDPTRAVREQGRVPSEQADPGLSDFDTVHVHHNIVRWKGKDWVYYTLSTLEMLSEPVALEEVYLHGIRPYVMGYVTFEAHKAYPQSKAKSVLPLQTLTNELTNLSIDNARLALNPRQKVRRGQNISLDQIRRFMPGNPIFLEDPTNDVVWDRPPDITGGAQRERDQGLVQFDEFYGSFSQGTVQTQRNLNETVGGMELLSGAAGEVSEYDLRVFTETWYEQALRQVVKLEQAYETDETILALAGKRAQIQKYGVDQVTDEMLNRELTTRVNVGIGATNPAQKQARFMGAAMAFGQIFGPKAVQMAKPKEIADELFGFAGYRDASRFLNLEPDPRIAELEQKIQELTAAVEDKDKDRQVKVEVAKISAEPQMMRAETDANRAGVEAMDTTFRMGQAEKDGKVDRLSRIMPLFQPSNAA